MPPGGKEPKTIRRALEKVELPEAEFHRLVEGKESEVVILKPPIAKRMDDALHAVLDAKPLEKITEELEDADIEKWSRVLARLYQRKEVKVDHTITAMGFLGLFPGATEK